ncbi:MAG TPA: oligosaccharide flippase family protein [Isosphaeraceae bacterium]|jgi:O-antigen/teichoic acid export membrane protein|nr:oligosaccharide flippase family protein [Isosphaeraceae bacterium]
MTADCGVRAPDREPAAAQPAAGPTIDGPGLRRSAARGALWVVAGYGLGQALRFGNNVVLAKLLAPEYFGLMGLVFTFLGGMKLFTDIGVGTSIIRDPRGDEPEFLDTAWTLQILRGLGLWAVAALLAYPLARFYGEPRILALLPFVALTCIVAGFNSTRLFRLNRHLELGRLARFELATQAASLAVMLAWAWLSPTIWALAGGSVAASVIYMVASHRLERGRCRLAWEPAAMRRIVSFGKWILLSTAIMFLAEYSDRLILGKLVPLETLGVYGIAVALAEVPRQLSIAVSGKVVFPAISRFIHLPTAEVVARIRRSRRLLLAAWGAGLVAMVVVGDLPIRVLYDRRYQQAAWMVPILALSLWPRILCNTVEPALFAVGRPQYMTLANVVRLLFTAIGIPIGFVYLGLPGAILVLALNDLPYYAVMNVSLRRERMGVTTQDLTATLLFAAALAAAAAARWAVGFGTAVDTMPRLIAR